MMLRNEFIPQRLLPTNFWLVQFGGKDWSMQFLLTKHHGYLTPFYKSLTKQCFKSQALMFMQNTVISLFWC